MGYIPVAEWYGAYTRSAHWRRVKLEVKSKRGPKCQICGKRKHRVVHHLTYARIGAERPEDLSLLCKQCHKSLHISLLRKGEKLEGMDQIRSQYPPIRVVPLLPRSYVGKVMKRGRW